MVNDMWNGYFEIFQLFKGTIQGLVMAWKLLH